ncbi:MULTISPECIES: TadE/TadG family type IV pilus assembly protein [Pseudonocardiaceae]|uniref:Pilus assembly protein TadE n=1 Tax=Prauserella endophytica TaxID=1592324 RepID=A0ABY2RTS5_9PSEU|nr:TadE/TadG family type IV pilus assembly protein [Amycolatopsis palatopharyngis]TKG60352.1 pilus assembly protein TadE [Prauserella endophytica]
MPARSIGRTRARGLAGRLRCALRGDRGEATLELVIATPLVLLALLAIIQFAVWSHATHVAQAAASQALAATRTQDGTTSAGHAAGQRLLAELAAGPLRHPDVTVSRGATTVSVSIRGEAAAVLPGVHLHVHAEAVGEVERFMPDVHEFTDSELSVAGNSRAGGAG